VEEITGLFKKSFCWGSRTITIHLVVLGWFVLLFLWDFHATTPVYGWQQNIYSEGICEEYRSCTRNICIRRCITQSYLLVLYLMCG